MTDNIAFTDNVRDLSNQEGYQFEFVCERCGNGYRSPFQTNVKERGRGMLRAASSLLGDRVQSLNKLSNAAETLSYDRGTNSPQKDKALREGGKAVSDNFKQCRGCGNWVCIPVCWNDEVGQCLNCSPSVGDELAKAQSAAQVEQIQQKVREVDWTEDVDVTTKAKVACPSCGKRVKGGKFCPECGENMSPSKHCTECGAKVDAGLKFCGECGTKV